jgi:glutathione S-transferase
MLELFHAAPSYYSMVARLALAEAGVAYVSRLMDIHLAKQQLSPAYRKLNPHMTVPTLRGPRVAAHRQRADPDLCSPAGRATAGAVLG